jgi:hypothetical protein
MAVAVGQRCVVRIKITGVELRNAKDIVATVESPQYVAHCQEVAFDEVSGLVYVAVDVNSAGSYSMWLEVRFSEELVYTPAFVFAEVEGEATPCEAPYIVDVEVTGESVSVTPPKIDVDAVTREEFELLSNAVAGKVDKVAGKGLSTNDYTDADKNAVHNIPILATKEEVQRSLERKADTDGNYPNMTVGRANGVLGINQVQEALILTTKANGNIVIGNLAGQSKEFMPATPSGDPMHYAYEAAGATWQPTTGYWKIYTLNDVTNEQMRASYVRGRLVSGEKMALAGSYRNLNAIRFNIARGGMVMTYLDSAYSEYFASENNVIEVINLTNYKNSTGQWDGSGATFATLQYSFNQCSKLKAILGVIAIASTNINTTNAFKGCTSLEDLQIKGLGSALSFADSPLLLKASLLYIINNCASGVSFIITLHPDVYEKCQEFGEWYSEIDAALTTATDDKNTTITLASA